MKKCPFCENDIPEDTKVCPYCNRDEVDLERGAVGLPARKKKTSLSANFALGISLFSLALALLSSMSIILKLLDIFLHHIIACELNELALESVPIWSILSIILGLTYFIFRLKKAKGAYRTLAAVAIAIFLLFGWAPLMSNYGVSRCRLSLYQSEAKTNLGSVFATQIAYFGENNTYGAAFTLIYWEPEGEERYSYFSPGDSWTNRKGDMTNCRTLPPGLTPAVSATGFTIYAIGNIDNDAYCDIWSINDARVLESIYDDKWNEP